MNINECYESRRGVYLKHNRYLVVLLSLIVLVLGLGYPQATPKKSNQPLPQVDVNKEIEKTEQPLAPVISQSPFNITPKLVGPGDEVTIVGGWSDQNDYNIYVVNDTEIYLVGKSGFNSGMKWNGVVEKILKTLDGKEVTLPNDRYHFVIEAGSNHWEGGQINLVPDSVPIPPGADVRMTAAMEVQVGFDLLTQRLNRYKDKTNTDYLQLKDYTISQNDINVLSGEFSPLLFEIKYSVLAVRPDSDWNIGAQPGSGDWLNKVAYMNVVADNGQFKINGISDFPPPQLQSDMYTPSITPNFTNPGSIAIELMSAYFKHFTADSIPKDQRLHSFKLNEIRITSQSAYGFMFYLDYTVQGTSEATSWCAGNGVIKANGLVENKVWFVRVSKNVNTYTMTGAGTSP